MKQAQALLAPRFLDPSEPAEVFYGGAAGGGKSDWLLMAALEYVDVQNYSSLIIRRTFSELALPGAIMARSKEWLSGTDARWNEQAKLWTFPSGATLQFAYLEHPDHVYRYQSAEFQFIGFDELTQFPEEPYRYMFSRLRRPSAGELAQVRLRMFSASNPGNVGHSWVKTRFITTKARPRSRCFVPAKIQDNEHLDEEQYRASLLQLPEALREQLMEGDWDAFAGAAYPSFDQRIHVVSGFEIPAEWERFEFMDHGISNPAAWYVCAVDYDGNLVVYDSYYSKGLISEHCDAVRAMRLQWYPQWTDPEGRERRQAPRTIADPSVTTSLGISSTKKPIPATIATEYTDQSDEEIVLIPGNHDRKAGRARIQQLLEPDSERHFPDWHPRSGYRGSPRLFIVGRNCIELVEQIKAAPLLPLDSGHRDAGEIVDPKWEQPYGHAHAALRYGVMSRPDPSKELEYPSDDLRVEFLKKIEKRWEEGSPQKLLNV